jgi:hypothetical protein
VFGGPKVGKPYHIALSQSCSVSCQMRHQLQLNFQVFTTEFGLQNFRGALGVQGEILSEKSGFELFVSFARLRHDFCKPAFFAQIAEQRIRFEIGIAEETAFNTAPQHSQ